MLLMGEKPIYTLQDPVTKAIYTDMLPRSPSPKIKVLTNHNKLLPINANKLEHDNMEAYHSTNDTVCTWYRQLEKGCY